MSDQSISEAANLLASESDSDVYLFNSAIRRASGEEVIKALAKRRRRKNATLILVTEGGDPDAAYRIARAFQIQYGTFTCLVAGYCKSAGTLIAVGAAELVMTDSAELGPLDVQMSKRDELWEAQSGLTVTAALTALHQSSFEAFEHFFMTIKRKSNNAVTLKTATEMAAKLTAGLFTPIYQQIDPLYVGEAQRAQAIAQQYGRRLSLWGQNITHQSLDNLIASYPTHGFVIDRLEADALFIDVRTPNAREQALLDVLEALATEPSSDGESKFLSTELTAPPEEAPHDAANPEHTDDSETRRPDGDADATPSGNA